MMHIIKKSNRLHLEKGTFMTIQSPVFDALPLTHVLDACVIGISIVDAQQNDHPLIYVNPAFEQMTGYTSAEVLGRNSRFLQGDDRDQSARALLRRSIDAGEPIAVILRNYRKDGTQFLIELNLAYLRDEKGIITHIMGYQQDVTEREAIRQAAAVATQRLTDTLDRLPTPFISYDHNWTVTYTNAAASAALGHPASEIIGQPLSVLSPDAHRLPILQAAAQALETGITQRVTTYSEALGQHLDAITYATDDGVAVLLRDITAERQLQLDLQASQERFSKVFEASPLAIAITRLRDGQFVDVNPFFLHLSGYTREELIGHTSEDLHLWPELSQRISAIETLRVRGQLLDQEATFQIKSGEIRQGMLSMVPITLEGDACIVSLIRDVSNEQRAQRTAFETATELQRTLDQSPDMIVSIDPQGRFVRVSAACKRLLGYRPEEMAGQPFTNFVHPDDLEGSLQAVAHPETLQGDTTFQNRYLHQDGSVVWMEWSSVQVLNGLLYAVARDVTARRAATEDQAFLASIVQASTDAIIGVSLDGTIRSWNPGAEQMFGSKAVEMIGQPLTGLIPPELLDEEQQIRARVARGERPGMIETIRMTRAGTRLPVQLNPAPIVDSQGMVVGISGIIQDISARQEAEQQILQLNVRLQQQLEHLTGLRAIDQAITSSLDLTLTLGMVLDQVKTELNADAVTMLLMNAYDLTLSCAASRGFTTSLPERHTVRLEDELAGRVALTRQPVILDDVQSAVMSSKWRNQLIQEGFSSYVAVPVTANGRMLGVIEVLRQQPFHLALDGLETLQTLASQAAIAIANAQLLLDLERGNFELGLAYQETIEGWARALDLRDHETEGHSRRVTEMTVNLCRILNVPPNDLVHVRRGALLHDIGKMGIADAILLKPGALTPEEWGEMRKHPGYAVELLSPIRFLRPALDIPQYHHEKWDGSGYPQGLKGSAIPLTARAFAVVDVYDALTNDRSYRKAWSHERAMAHLQAQAGTHFDPAVVQAFLTLFR
ncbi:PAS domain S-box protein (plasmid) [Deinococcus sp. KNUC1210]|uniref:PAS domain S-box protein n=1 Tax=Deinococcus sp. KNUC1210 TaxID=2917691 RepID=UPI001EF1180E|nr:PAS domain S-box protein [Deinococcus sp. KNUC1210]ULH18237.1 PAS domain S-box protein [Deinococcus sp. KNUC1210]